MEQRAGLTLDGVVKRFADVVAVAGVELQLPEGKLISFLGRHFGPPKLFLAVALWILALGAWGMAARTYLPIEHRLRWEIPLELRAPLYAKFDSGWYLAIIEWGYGKPPPDG